MLDFVIKLQQVDRRWIYLAVAIACVVPFIVPMKLSVRLSQETCGVYNAVDACPRDKAVPQTPGIYYLYGAAVVLLFALIYLLARRPPRKPAVPETVEPDRGPTESE